MGGIATDRFRDSIDWSDGVLQTEMDLESGERLTSIAETQRQLSSCPVLFSWDGEAWVFVSDFLGVGGIGYALGPGQYNEPRPWERFMMPPTSLAPSDGRLVLKVGEPMEEIAYLDAARLVAYDLPPGWLMTVDERMAILGPEPTGDPIFARRAIAPVHAVNDRGEDVTDTVLATDLRAAPVGDLDLRFIGRLESEHRLTLVFDEDLDRLGDNLVLIADGWVEYPYSQTNFAAWQASADYRAPSLEARGADGSWTLIFEQFGYPAGMPRQMALPLPSRCPLALASCGSPPTRRSIGIASWSQRPRRARRFNDGNSAWRWLRLSSPDLPSVPPVRNVCRPTTGRGGRRCGTPVSRPATTLGSATPWSSSRPPMMRSRSLVPARRSISSSRRRQKNPHQAGPGYSSSRSMAGARTWTGSRRTAPPSGRCRPPGRDPSVPERLHEEYNTRYVTSSG